jgi:DNA transformation protein
MTVSHRGLTVRRAKMKPAGSTRIPRYDAVMTKPAGDSFKDYVLDQLSELEGVTARAMFGGHGLYCGKTFFGILWRGRLFLKTNDRTRPGYEDRGMKPFAPNQRQTLKNYFEVPADVVERADELCRWAQQACAV